MWRTLRSSQFYSPCCFPAIMWCTFHSPQFFPPSCVSVTAPSFSQHVFSRHLMHIRHSSKLFPLKTRLEKLWSCIAFELFCVNWNMPKWLFRPFFIPSRTRWVIKCHFALEIQVCRTSSVRHGVSGGRLVDAHSTNFCVISRSGKFICETKLLFLLVCHWLSRFVPRRNGEYSSPSCFKIVGLSNFTNFF